MIALANGHTQSLQFCAKTFCQNITSTYTCKPAPFDRQTNAKENPEMQSYYHQAAVAAIAAEEPI
jgi:hypothetical protein